MSPEERLAEIVLELDRAGVKCLVMGGHAVRYYGLMRHTNDFDLHLAPEAWSDLAERLRSTNFCGGKSPEEGVSWRPADFRRFRIGTLQGGQEEWLEFWRANHLLAPFADLYARREEGAYGGGRLSFLSLPDLIRSKETEREKDWDDIEILEELHSERLLCAVKAGRLSLPDALALLRCRRGLEAFARSGDLSDAQTLGKALAKSHLAITQALLLPLLPHAQLPAANFAIEPVVLHRLRSVSPATPLHFALVEIVRRQHRMLRQAADRADKERVRAARERGST